MQVNDPYLCNNTSHDNYYDIDDIDDIRMCSSRLGNHSRYLPQINASDSPNRLFSSYILSILKKILKN